VGTKQCLVPMDKAPPISKRLKQARLQAGLSQRQLGVLAGIDAFSASPRINQYERAKHTPDFGTAERLGQVLRVAAAYFYARDEDLAELIMLFGRVSSTDRRKALTQMRRLAAKHK
jgi:transcriptional regulator with XRE-family HTH domain